MPKTSRQSYIKALFMIVMIILVAFVINKLSKKADIEDYGKYKAQIDSYKQMITFKEEQKDSATIPFAGFWQLDIPAKGMDSPGKSDRIEFKRNGIIWRVITSKQPTATGDTITFRQAYTAYLRPFASFKNNASKVTFDVHMIRQTFMVGLDTCYGESNWDTTWEIIRNPQGIRILDNQYSQFDTTDLKHFFPEGAIDKVEAVSISQCEKGFSFEKFAYEKGFKIKSSSAISKKEAK